jgi:serine/threonine protein kinase
MSDQNDQTMMPPEGKQPEPPPADELIGKMMGQFQVIEEIGRGGMATVYRATQQSMNRNVAIKILPRQMLHDPGFYDRFVREVEVISQLEHPHILPIYDYGQSDGIPFIAMRYLGGGSLDQRIRKGLMAFDEIERPLRQVAQALDYAHQQGIIHRDLKPGNIMLDENNNAYLSDFGIARVLGSELTGSMIIGTPAYMSPEQANGLTIDGRSDIYSLGIVLFELLTGRGPFQAETPMAVLLKHITEPVPPISDFRNDVPDVIEQVILRATAKDPDERFSSAGDMAEAYSNALRGQAMSTDRYPPLNKGRSGTPPPMSNTANPTAQATMPPSTQPNPTTGTYPPQAQRGTSLSVVIGIVIVLLAVVGGGVVVLTQNNDSGRSSVNALPTPFPRASTINQNKYTISMPDEWIPPQIFIDQSTENRLRHVWTGEDNEAFIALSILDIEIGTGGMTLLSAISSYIETRYPGQFVSENFIDGNVADDGTVRRSFRIPDREDEALGTFNTLDRPGQLDVFFSAQGGNLVVLEMYTADSTGNTLVPRLQLILDSLRVSSPTTASR